MTILYAKAGRLGRSTDGHGCVRRWLFWPPFTWEFVGKSNGLQGPLVNWSTFVTKRGGKSGSHVGTTTAMPDSSQTFPGDDLDSSSPNLPSQWTTCPTLFNLSLWFGFRNKQDQYDSPVVFQGKGSELRKKGQNHERAGRLRLRLAKRIPEADHCSASACLPPCVRTCVFRAATCAVTCPPTSAFWIVLNCVGPLHGRLRWHTPRDEKDFY